MKYKDESDSEFTHKEIYGEKSLSKLDSDLSELFERENIRNVRVIYSLSDPETDEKIYISKTFSKELLNRIESFNESVSDFMDKALSAEGYENLNFGGCEIEANFDL